MTHHGADGARNASSLEEDSRSFDVLPNSKGRLSTVAVWILPPNRTARNPPGATAIVYKGDPRTADMRPHRAEGNYWAISEQRFRILPAWAHSRYSPKWQQAYSAEIHRAKSPITRQRPMDLCPPQCGSFSMDIESAPFRTKCHSYSLSPKSRRDRAGRCDSLLGNAFFLRSPLGTTRPPNGPTSWVPKSPPFPLSKSYSRAFDRCQILASTQFPFNFGKVVSKVGYSLVQTCQVPHRRPTISTPPITISRPHPAVYRMDWPIQLGQRVRRPSGPVCPPRLGSQ